MTGLPSVTWQDGRQDGPTSHPGMREVPLDCHVELPESIARGPSEKRLQREQTISAHPRWLDGRSLGVDAACAVRVSGRENCRSAKSSLYWMDLCRSVPNRHAQREQATSDLRPHHPLGKCFGRIAARISQSQNSRPRLWLRDEGRSPGACVVCCRRGRAADTRQDKTKEP